MHNAKFRSGATLSWTSRTGCRAVLPASGGGVYVYPSCAGVIGKRTAAGKTIANDEDFVRYLFGDTGDAVVHGEAVGLSPHFRISYATSTEVLRDACTRIEHACRALSG